MIRIIFLTIMGLSCFTFPKAPDSIDTLYSKRPPSPDIIIDFTNIIGQIKPLHGVNDGPFNYGSFQFPIEKFHKEAGFPFNRLHDANWPSGDAVDIHSIFPNWNADVNAPSNYHFEKTDDYIKAIIETGARIIYRLGESIEHKTDYYIHPPKDYDKWAEICLNIIRHYNEGWDDGFHYGIEYWEIWNEPEGKGMWRGTRAQIFDLYRVAASKIKSTFPKLKVGGLAFTNINHPWVDGFLQYCKAGSLPLDFLSWHIYTSDPSVIVADSRTARSILDGYGFTKTENVLDEWHYLHLPFKYLFPGDSTTTSYLRARNAFRHDMNDQRSAAFAASVLSLLQDEPIDIATYYNADYYNPFSMFDEYGLPTKSYYSFKAFNGLYKLKSRVATQITQRYGDDGVTCLAASSIRHDNAAVLISNFSPGSKNLKIALKGLVNDRSKDSIELKIYGVDDVHSLELVGSEMKLPIQNNMANLTLELMPNSVYLIRISKDVL